MANPAPGTIDEMVQKMIVPAELEAEPNDGEKTEEEKQEEIPESVEPVVEGDTPETAEEPEGQPEPETVSISALELKDLRNGNLMQADYTQKTMALAEQRRVVEENTVAFQALLEQAEAVAQLDREDLGSTENLELKEYDRTAFEEKKERVDKKQAQLTELKAKRTAQIEEDAAETIARETDLLLPAIPEWIDQEKMVSEMQMCSEMWAKMGFTNEDLKDKYNDHRLIVISRKAALYDELQAKQQRVDSAKPEDKQVTDTPKTVQPGTVTSKQDGISAKRKETSDRARETGRPQDAVAALLTPPT